MAVLTAPTVEANGARIPQMGMGTMTLKEAVCVEAVKDAISIGYCHLDTATFYENEKAVGDGLKAAGIARDQVFVTTKVRPHDLKPDDFDRAVDASLAALQLTQVDLLLIHWNNKDVPLKDSVAALCRAKRAGKTRHVGVANFTTGLLDEAWRHATEPLVCNQIEVHPFINQDKVIDASRKRGMAVVAYCPIARGKATGNEVLVRIGQAHDKSWAQVSLRYLVQLGLVPIPRTATPDHLRQNLDVFDFQLDDAEMAELKKLNAANMRVVSPPWAPQWDAP